MRRMTAWKVVTERKPETWIGDQCISYAMSYPAYAATALPSFLPLAESSFRNTSYEDRQGLVSTLGRRRCELPHIRCGAGHLLGRRQFVESIDQGARDDGAIGVPRDLADVLRTTDAKADG